MKRMTSFAALALLTACAPAAEAPSAGPTPVAAVAAAVNPVGTFEFTTTADGETLTGSITVSGQPGAYTGRIRTAHDDIPIIGVSVTGQQMVVTGDTPGGPLTLTLNFTGTTFTGSWAVDGDKSEIRGQRMP